MKKSYRKILSHLITYITLFCFLIIVIFPFYWMFITSLRSTGDLYSKDTSLWPRELTFDHYKSLLTKTNFIRWFANSWFVAVVTTLVSIIVGLFAAYSLAHLRFPGRGLIAQIILITYLVPRTVLFIPLYNMLREFGLIDSHLGLIMSYTTFAVPFATWMMMGYLQTIPRELDEAARIDGCSRWGSLFRVILPVSLPGIIASGIFSFNLANNEYLYALAFINRESLNTLPRGLSSMIMGDVYLWGQMMSACLLSSLPLAILYIFLQKYLVSGMTAGAVKG